MWLRALFERMEMTTLDWKVPALGNDTSLGTQCLPMPASCSMIKIEVKDVVTMNLESDIKVFVLNDGCDIKPHI